MVVSSDKVVVSYYRNGKKKQSLVLTNKLDSLRLYNSNTMESVVVVNSSVVGSVKGVVLSVVITSVVDATVS